MQQFEECIILVQRFSAFYNIIRKYLATATLTLHQSVQRFLLAQAEIALNKHTVKHLKLHGTLLNVATRYHYLIASGQLLDLLLSEPPGSLI